jgi:hypothetical protein
MNTYPETYSPKPVAEQIDILSRLLKNTPLGNEKMPRGAEALFVIPTWESIADSYPEAVRKVLDMVSESRDFTNFCTLDNDHLRESEHKREKVRSIPVVDTPLPHRVVPAQFGLRWRGKSVRDVHAGYIQGEFGLGAYEVGIMLLTHPERLQGYTDLWLDLPGDEYAPDADGGFCKAPCFAFYDGEVKFASGFVDYARGCYGSVSAFLPQNLVS